MTLLETLKELKSETLKSTIIERFNELSHEEQSILCEDTLYNEINHNGIADLWYHLSEDDKVSLSDELYNIMENNPKIMQK